eukprot:5055693-Amphidinium_carterae.1
MQSTGLPASLQRLSRSSSLHIHWPRSRLEDPVLHHVQHPHRDPTDQHQVVGWMFPGCHR